MSSGITEDIKVMEMKNKYSPDARKILHYLLSHPFDRVSLMTHLPPQVKATLQAMYSRNDMPMRDTLLKTIVMVDLGLKKNSDYDALSEQEKEKVYEKYATSVPQEDPPLYRLLDQKAEGFLGEWVIKHGHKSIQEGAFISYIAEGVSVITAKALEDDPLFHGQELSTRYKSFEKKKVIIPASLDFMRQELEQYFSWSLENYRYATKTLNEYQEKAFPKPEDISATGWKQVLAAETFDNARYYLNAGITTSLGIVEDARTLERKLRNMLVSPVLETRMIAEEIIEKAKYELPTLIRHTEPNVYRKETEKVMSEELQKVMGGITSDSAYSALVKLIDCTQDLENKIIAALLYGESHHRYGWQDIYDRVKNLSSAEKKHVLEKVFLKLGKYDDPLRALRMGRLCFELYPDYGAWRDIQRHRRSNQTFPLPTCDYGYAIPRLIDEAGLGDHYTKHQEKTKELFDRAREFSPEAIIIPTLGFRVKQLIDADIEEWVYIWRLRTTAYSHFSYGRLFLETFEQAKPMMPFLTEIIEQHGLIDKKEYKHGRLVEERRHEEKQKTYV